jgi:hypothetical protein
MSQPMNPAQPIAMATPIQTLPVQGQGHGQATTDMSDPLVSDVLNEMEKEVQNATQPSMNVSSFLAQAQMNHPVIPSLPTMAFPSATKSSSWIHMDNLKRVVVCMLLSFVLFNPSWLFPHLYQRYDRLHFLQNYDMMVRVVLFGMFLYILWTYVPYP